MIIIEYRIKEQKLKQEYNLENIWERRLLVSFLNTAIKDDNKEILDVYLKEEATPTIEIIDHAPVKNTILPSHLQDRFDDIKRKLKNYRSYNS